MSEFQAIKQYQIAIGPGWPTISQSTLESWRLLSCQQARKHGWFRNARTGAGTARPRLERKDS